jgi:hypothetical protein
VTICPAPGTFQAYNWLGATNYKLRRRTGFVSAYGAWWGVHESTASSFNMTPAFHSTASDMIEHYASNAYLYAGKAISWIGTAGAGQCDDKPHHGNARAIDITRVQFSDGSAVDTRGSWSVAEIGNNRLYAGLIATFRLYLGPGSVLSSPISGGHEDHVHTDTSFANGPLTTSSPADRVLLRRINRVFGQSSIAVNSNAWTPADGTATRHTLNLFGFASCYSIFTNGWHTLGFLDAVSKCGVANRPAGYFSVPAC